MRERINAALKEAMKAKDAGRLSTLRLISAAIKDREIAARGDGEESVIGDDEVLAILGKMVKQRQESARQYEEGGRLELAEKERGEISVIEDFLPRQLDDAEVDAAITAAMAEVGAESIRDMGKVMGLASKAMAGQADGKVISQFVRAALQS